MAELLDHDRAELGERLARAGITGGPPPAGRDQCREGNACLIRHGDRWRAAATRSLIELGLRQPAAIVLPAVDGPAKIA
jgi:hypothetical protein